MRDVGRELEIEGCARTLAIDDDVLTLAKAIARQQHTSVGKVLSELARRALHRPIAPGSRNDVPLLPVSEREAIVALERVNAPSDERP